MTVEADFLRRLPCVVIVGLASSAVREAADRVRTALTSEGIEFSWPRQRIVVTLSPTDLRKQGTHYDLPIAVAIFAGAMPGTCKEELLEETALLGSLALDGRVQSVRSVVAMVEAARDAGASRVIVPLSNLVEAQVVKDIEVVGVDHLREVTDWLLGRPLPMYLATPQAQVREELCMSDIRGMATARRAVEVAAAGGHSLLLVGSPGSGKTMLAARVPSILPPLTEAGALEVTRIRSAVGLQDPTDLDLLGAEEPPSRTGDTGGDSGTPDTGDSGTDSGDAE